MWRDNKPKGRKTYFWIIGAMALLLLLITACGDGDGEDRPGIEVIDGGAGSVSVSGTGTGTGTGSGTGTGTGTGSATGTGTGTATGTATGTGSGTGTGTATAPGDGTFEELVSDHYTTVSNVVSHASISLDMRDINSLLSNAKSGEPVDWEEITSIYENGRNSVKGDGSMRTLHSLATSSSVLAEFPGDIDLEANVRTGLDGQWLGETVDDNARRNLVDKSNQAIIYGKVNQELTSARNQLAEGNTDDASGAPHKVDEGWAFYVGLPGDGSFPYSISATARKREGNFGLEGMVDAPLQQALATALEASRTGDLGAFDAAAAEARGYLNTIFYLATLRYGAIVFNDDNEVARKIHLAEGWAFFQPIHAAVASASSASASTVEEHFTRDAADTVPGADVVRLYAALNTDAVISALGIPAGVRVTSPTQLR